MEGEEWKNAGDTCYVSYEINGTNYSVLMQPQMIEEDNLSKLNEPIVEEQGTLLMEESQSQEEQQESIPLVLLNGRVYAIQNQELHEIDIGQLGCEEPLIPNNDASLVDSRDNDSVQKQPDVANFSQEKTNERLGEDNCEVDVSIDDGNILVKDETSINANDFVDVVMAFKCKICPYTTQDKELLLKHFQDIHVNPNNEKSSSEEEEEENVKLLYMCGECSKCFPTLEDCKVHMIDDHKLTSEESEKNDTCDSSNMNEDELLIGHSGDRANNNGTKRQVKIPKVLNSEYLLNKKTVESKDKNIKCSYKGCSYKFRTENSQQEHLRCHVKSDNYNAFQCHVCKEAFAKWKPCTLHLWKKHEIDVDLLSCKICKVYKTASTVKLLTHMRVHNDSRDYECQVCGKCFKQSSQLRNHRVMHLDRKTIDIPRWYTSKTCDICGKTYADSKCLKNHIQAVHSKLKPYVCNVCGHSSARKAMLQMHLRQHTGDKPFSCDICEYKTGDHNSLRRHIMRHTGQRPYKCPHCPYSSIQSNSYKNHLRSKHPLMAGLFTCELCSFKTVKKESYLQHVSDHEKGLIKTPVQREVVDDNVKVFPGNIAAAQLIYSCLGAFSKVGKTIEANLMSSSTSVDGTSQTITIQIPSKHLEGSLPTNENVTSSTIEQDDDETMHCFLKIPHEEEENIDTGGITIPAEPENVESPPMDIEN